MKAQDDPRRHGSAPREHAANAFVAELPKRFRVGVIGVLRSRIPRVGADRGPGSSCVSALRSLRPGEGPRSATRLRSVRGSRGRSAQPTGRFRRPPMLVISDGAQMSGRTTPAAAAARRQWLCTFPCTRSCVGTPDGVVNVPIAGGYQAQLRVPPSPETLQDARSGDGRAVLHRTRPERDCSQIHERLGSRLGHRRENA